MKLEVLNSTTNEVIDTYSASNLSMLSFQEWKDDNEVQIPLDQLSSVIAGLNSIDPITDEPNSVAISVEFYLPGPVENMLTDRLVRQEANTEQTSSLLPDLRREIIDQVRSPSLNVSTILLAIVEEILRNHLPKDAYKVRISDE